MKKTSRIAVCEWIPMYSRGEGRPQSSKFGMTFQVSGAPAACLGRINQGGTFRYSRPKGRTTNGLSHELGVCSPGFSP